tara:strand:- start:1011 stop:3554 length:2544 start_codon:yes stop_codon:yes gene_type:complete
MPNLVGIGNTQVPTNGMLGKLAYKNSVDPQTIAKIKAKTSDTATAVFVYDTRKDSDGGAWRFRTQDTSWYNEPLGAEFRGVRKEFPAVAILVAQARKITIYDADDPNCPMWMVFVDAGGSHSTGNCGMIMGNGNITDIVALNGIMATTHVGDHKCLVRIYFVSDRAVINPGNTYWGEGEFRGRIADRHTQNGFYVHDGVNRLSDNGRCVAMKVTGNSPIDPDTGLPTPTFGIGGDGGTHVIVPNSKLNDGSNAQNNGDEFKITNNNSSFSYPINIKFTDDNLLFWNYTYLSLTDDLHCVLSDIPTEDETRSSSHIASINAGWNDTYDRPPFLMTFKDSGGSLGGASIATGRDFLYGGTKSGLSILRRNAHGVANLSSVNKTFGDKEAMTSQITTTYNSGYQLGRIALACLSSTDTSDLSASVVLNEDFHVDITGWTAAANTTITHEFSGVSGNCMKIAVDANGVGGAYYSITTVVGQEYTVTYYAKHITGGTGVRLRVGTSALSSANIQQQSVASTSGSFTGPYRVGFKATATTTVVSFYLQQSNTAIVDDMIVELSDPQRANGGLGVQDSNRNGGLGVKGTLTRKTVAPGAELVGYSGWSSSNYLMSLLNQGGAPGTSSVADNVGTEYPASGDYSVMFWWKPSTLSAVQVLWSIRNPSAASNHWIQLWHHSTNERLEFEEKDTGSRNLQVNYPEVSTSQWNCIVAGKKSGVMYLYVNGRLKGKNTSTSKTITTSLFHQHRIGCHYDGQYPVSGDMALFRYSRNCPTYDQVKQIYNDEKKLFAPNAKCTIYGSSDDVNDVAYDSSTEILHAGTSSGRSEFQGLNRINNTTTGVALHISASDGLIAEQ